MSEINRTKTSKLREWLRGANLEMCISEGVCVCVCVRVCARHTIMFVTCHPRVLLCVSMIVASRQRDAGQCYRSSKTSINEQCPDLLPFARYEYFPKIGDP